MNSMEKLNSLYRKRHGCEAGTRLLADITEMLRHGYVLCTPDAFVLGFTTTVDSICETLQRGIPVSASENCVDGGDCWFVWAAAGPIKKILSLVPYPLKNVAFARRGVVKVWRYESLLNHALHVPESLHSPLAESRS